MSQSQTSSALKAWGPVLVVLASVLTTGCATIGDTSAMKLPGAAGPDGAESAVAPQSRCTIVLQPSRGEPEVVEMPLSEGATVQSALKFSKGTRKFGRMEIFVLRKTPPGIKSPVPVQKMTVEYNRKRRRIEPEYDYALHADDRIVLKEDPTTIIDDTVEAIAGRMGIPIVTQLIK